MVECYNGDVCCVFQGDMCLSTIGNLAEPASTQDSGLLRYM